MASRKLYLKDKVLKSQLSIMMGMHQSPGLIAWTGGKDSTVILHLIKSMFGRIPWKVFFNNTGDVFDEQIEFIEKIKQDWNLSFIEISEPDKVKAIQKIIEIEKPNFIMSGIRWDEHPARSKEQVFSSRKDHMRIHPILHWVERDICHYIHEYDVPYYKLYNRGYRSLGEKSKTKVPEKGQGERAGREQKKEEVMNKLRKMGYW